MQTWLPITSEAWDDRTTSSARNVTDQGVGRRVVRARFSRCQLWLNRFGQLFPELHSPLVEGVDAPDGTLHEYLVLVHGDQATERSRGEAVEHDAVGGAVALEHLVRQQGSNLCRRQPSGLEFTPSLGLSLPLHQRLCLRQKVGEKNGVVRERLFCLDSRLGVHRREEVAGDQLSALVNQLVKSMLAVRSWLTPNDRAGRGADGLPLPGDSLSVALHVPLLQVCREAMQALVIRQNCLRLGAKEVVVPDAKHSQDHRQILVHRRSAEVLVHVVGAAKKLLKVVHANAERNREANSTPE
mmetsp:Transcript_17835/g.42034  ORF Transcript_17835/g.42034 Transcript_17835/m.42034 type:complete len:298 (+) Transcript_17835:1005-1898(+)